MKIRGWVAGGALALSVSCGGPGAPAVRPPDAPLPVVPLIEVKTGQEYPDLDGKLGVWKAAVLERVAPESLPNLRAQVQARVELYEARDRDLQSLPAGLAVERRLEVAQQLMFEKACLKAVDAKMGR